MSENIGTLVVHRKLQQAIVIGDDIEVKVVELTKGRVRLAIKAPRNVKILRDEIIAREAERAGT